MVDEYIALGLILALAMYLFWTARLRTDVVALLVMLALILPWPHADWRWRGILTYQEGFSGFGNAAVIMVAAMFIFGAAMVRTGAVSVLGGKLFSACAHSEVLLQAVVLVVTTFVSMFVNDTTVVLVFLPVIMSVCKEKNLSPSRYLMIVAYGSLLGGQWTLIGTRSNIVISDYLLHKTGTPLGFFDFTTVAAVIFAACAAYFLLLGRRFLPKPGEGHEPKHVARYLSIAVVASGSKAVGKKLDELKWRKRTEISILEIVRGMDRMPPDGWIRLQAGDLLVVQGPKAAMNDVLESPDLELREESEIAAETLKNAELLMAEATLAPASEYAGYTLDELGFTREFAFTVMDISRQGERIRETPSATRLRFGDTLLLIGHASGFERLQRNPNLLLLDQPSIPGVNKNKALVLLALLAGIIGGAVSGLLTPAISIPVAAMLAILFRCVRIPELYHAVDWQSIVTVAGMIPFGLALEKSGAAAAIAQLIGQNVSGYGPTFLLGSILLLAVLLTQLIENAAVAIILSPIAYQVAFLAGVNPKPFLVGLGICVSAAFCTPVAHESTILVMGPGRYRFKHYLQIGGIMAFLTWMLATLITPVVWPFR
jgi:di/tricarboxylate transporter